MRNDQLQIVLSKETWMLSPGVMSGLEAFANNETTGIINIENADNSVKTQIVGNVGIISIEGAMYKKPTVNMCMSVLSYPDIISTMLHSAHQIMFKCRIIS